MGNKQLQGEDISIQIQGKNENERLKDYFTKLNFLSKFKKNSLKEDNFNDLFSHQLAQSFASRYPNEIKRLNDRLDSIYLSFISQENSRIDSFSHVDHWKQYFNNESKHYEKFIDIFRDKKNYNCNLKLPKLISYPYFIRFQKWFEDLKEEKKSFLFIVNPEEKEWSKFCEDKFSDYINLSERVFEDISEEIKKAIIEIIGFSINKFCTTLEEEYNKMMDCIFRSIPSIQDIKNDFLDKKKMPLEIRKEIFSQALYSYSCGVEKLGNENRKLFLFAIFCILLNLICNNNAKIGIYYPLRRKIACKILKKLHNYEDSLANFYTISKLYTFEKFAGNFIKKLQLLPNISAPIQSLYNVDYYDDSHQKEEITSFDLIGYFQTHKESRDMRTLLGQSPDEILKDLIKCTLVKISGNTSSTHVIICISGFMSEDHDEEKMWEQLIEFYPDSLIYAVKYSSAKGRKIMSLFHQRATEVIFNPMKTEKMIGIFDESRKVFVKEMNQALIQAELTGKALAALITLREPFKSECISLIGFSLGTVVLKSCIKYLYNFKAFNHVHEIIMMGGAASFNKKEIPEYSRYLSSIVGKVYNCYIHSDVALNLFRSFYFCDPIGLQEQKLDLPGNNSQKKSQDSKSFTNINLQELIVQHWEYRPNLKNILKYIQNYNGNTKE